MPADKRKEQKFSGNASPALPRISEAELVVMKVIWGQAPITTNQVVGALEHQVHWKPKTIHTLLRRLVRKEALAFEKQGREYLFRPLIAANDFIHAASRSFLRRFFDGEVAPFLACLLEKEKLKPGEIRELKRLLDEKRP